MALVLVSQNAVDAQLFAALLAVCLDRLHIRNVAIAKLSDQAELVYEWLISVHVEQTGLLCP